MKIDTADQTIRFYIGDLIVKNAQLEEVVKNLKDENKKLKEAIDEEISKNSEH